MAEHEPDKYDKAVTRMFKRKLVERSSPSDMEVDKSPNPATDTVDAGEQEEEKEKERKRRRLVENETQMDEDKWENTVKCPNCDKINSAVYKFCVGC